MMVFFMKVSISKLTDDSYEISNVQKFLFSMIKLEFGYDYVPEWHQDIVKIDEYYVFVIFGDIGSNYALNIGLKIHNIPPYL